MLFTQFLGWLGREVYLGFVPVDRGLSVGAEHYLPDLWKQAPKRVAATHTLLALLVQLLPLVIIGRPLLFSWLSASQKNLFIRRLLHSRFYIFRLVAYGVKGHALVAILRYPESRRSLVESKREQRHLVRAAS